MTTTIKHATIKGREYRAVTTTYNGGSLSSTVVEVRVVFAGDHGAVWRALPWFAEARIQEVLKIAV